MTRSRAPTLGDPSDDPVYGGFAGGLAQSDSDSLRKAAAGRVLHIRVVGIANAELFEKRFVRCMCCVVFAAEQHGSSCPP